MVTLQIEHKITDYPSWRAAFDALAGVRRIAGVVSGRVARPVDDPCYIVVTLEHLRPRPARHPPAVVIGVSLVPLWPGFVVLTRSTQLSQA